MNLINQIFESPIIYSYWSKPFIGPKLQAIAKLIPNYQGMRVLDIGCGPASNTEFFKTTSYTGIDINPRYIEYAQKRYPDKIFMVQDACALNLESRYDLVIINSLLHHLPNQAGESLFLHLQTILNVNGKIIFLEPLIPQTNEYIKSYMMKLDRGKFFRTYDQYTQLFGSILENEQKIVFDLYWGCVPCWTTLVMRLGRKI